MSSQVLPLLSRLATSAVVTSVDSGLRSSWLASEKKARCELSESSSLSSIRFIVEASAAISSPVGGTSTRSCNRRPSISETCRRIRSTVFSDRPTKTHTATATSATRSGVAASSSNPTVRRVSVCTSRGAATSTT